MVKEIIGEVKGKDLSNVIIFCDILGGTPSNASLKVLNDFPELTIVTGFNLPMLIESLISIGKEKKKVLELLSDVHEQSLTIIDSSTLDISDTTLDEETECYDL